MTTLDYGLVEETAKALFIRALKELPPDVKAAVRAAAERETHPRGKPILETMLKNIDVAEEHRLLVCQDTGIPIYKVKLGTRLVFNGIKLAEAITKGCERATVEYPFRSSICHALTRHNPQTSTGHRMPIIDFDFEADSDRLTLRMMPKGSGSENMSFLRMLTPAQGLKGIKQFVIDAVLEAGGKACPPCVVGVGLGGSADLAMRLAKEAIFRPIGTPNPDPQIADLEAELLAAINKTGIGPMGLGGDTTAFAVHIEEAHTHITMNPVGINFQCWRGERASATLYPDGRVEYGY